MFCCHTVWELTLRGSCHSKQVSDSSLHVVLLILIWICILWDGIGLEDTASHHRLYNKRNCLIASFRHSLELIGNDRCKFRSKFHAFMLMYYIMIVQIARPAPKRDESNVITVPWNVLAANGFSSISGTGLTKSLFKTMYSNIMP